MTVTVTGMTFDAFSPISLGRRAITTGTHASYLRLHEHATPTLGKLRINRITTAHVQDCLADCRTHMGLKTVQNVLKYVRSVLRDAGSTVADRLQVPVHEPDTRVLDTGELRLLQARLLQAGDLHSTAVLVLLGTGLRRGELLALKPSDWREGFRQLHISKSKSRRVRDVDVPDWLVPVLNAHPTLFSSCNRNTLRTTLDRACDELGLERMRLHDLRHTRITYLLLQGTPPLYVSQQAGHSSPAFTLARYGHLVAATPQQRREWCNA